MSVEVLGPVRAEVAEQEVPPISYDLTGLTNEPTRRTERA